MLYQRLLWVGFSIVLLVGCEQTTAQREANAVRTKTQAQADDVREQTQGAAQRIRDRSDDADNEVANMKDTLESRADAVENKGERAADIIEEKGEQTADQIEATEDAYWQNHYSARPYVTKTATYDTYRSAYRFGWRARQRHSGKSFDDVSSGLEKEWNEARSNNDLSWTDAEQAVRDAWDRVK